MRFEQAHIEMNAETIFELRAPPATERRKRDTNGRIAHKHIGPLLPHDLESTMLPLIRELHQR
jgi:hypothetical protein